MKFSDVYIHFDTLALRGDAAVIGLGLALFNEQDPRQSPTVMYWSVSLADQESLGRAISTESIEWWRTDAPYREPFVEASFSLFDALNRALDVIEQRAESEARVWVWSALLEGAILQSLLDTFGIEIPPWMYWNVREGRTLIDTAARATGNSSPATPYGSTPQEHMVVRVALLQEASDTIASAVQQPLLRTRSIG